MPCYLEEHQVWEKMADNVAIIAAELWPKNDTTEPFSSYYGVIISFSILQPWSPFLERPGNFSCAKANFEIKSSWTVPQFLAYKFKPINFASIIDSFNIVSFQNYWNSDLECKHGKQKTTFRARKVIGNFEKRASEVKQRKNVNDINNNNNFGRLLGKFISSSLPARLMEEFPASKVHLQPAAWLTGKFPSKRTSRHYWPLWVLPKGEVQPFSWAVGGGGGEGRFLTNNTNNTILDTKSPQKTWIVYFRGNLSFQGHINSSKSPSQHILRNRSIGCPWK